MLTFTLTKTPVVAVEWWEHLAQDDNGHSVRFRVVRESDSVWRCIVFVDATLIHDDGGQRCDTLLEATVECDRLATSAHLQNVAYSIWAGESWVGFVLPVRQPDVELWQWDGWEAFEFHGGSASASSSRTSPTQPTASIDNSGC